MGPTYSPVKWVPRSVCVVAVKLTAAEGKNEWSYASIPACHGSNRYNFAFTFTFTTLFIDVRVTKWVPFGHSNVVSISKCTITHSLKFLGGIKVNPLALDLDIYSLAYHVSKM